MDVSVSPAETLTAGEVWRQVGTADRRLLHDALAMALAKTLEDKLRFSACFALFFSSRVPADATIVQDETTWQTLDRFLMDGEYVDARNALRAVREGRLAQLMWAASERLPPVQSLRDKPRAARYLQTYLGLDELARAWREAQETDAWPVASSLGFAHQRLQGVVDDWLAAHHQLQGDHQQLQARIIEQPLSTLPPDYDAQMRDAILTLAAQLKRQRSRKRKQRSRLRLHVPAVLRASVACDGVPMKLFFRPRRRREPSVFVICDISGSMSRMAHFFLLLMQQLQDELPSLRCFVFSASLGEVTAQLPDLSGEGGFAQILSRWGHGTTDYGAAAAQFARLTQGSIKARSKIIVLGDARSNYLPAQLPLWRRLGQRCGGLIWLNPEPTSQWQTGDSLMPLYAPCTRYVSPLRNLRDLERIARTLLD